VALKTDGSLWAWGQNVDGQLGNGDNIGNSQFRPIRVGTENDWVKVETGDNHSLSQKVDNSLWAWGDNLDGQVGDGTRQDKRLPLQVTAPQTWRHIAGGESHTLAVRSDGTLWGWGSNTQGQVGDATDFNPAPVDASNDWGMAP
jgi:alpha-tubulin suppressor-like RCC1 family protein